MALAQVANVLRLCLERWPKQKCEMKGGGSTPSDPPPVSIYLLRWQNESVVVDGNVDADRHQSPVLPVVELVEAYGWCSAAEGGCEGWMRVVQAEEWTYSGLDSFDGFNSLK